MPAGAGPKDRRREVIRHAGGRELLAGVERREEPRQLPADRGVRNGHRLLRGAAKRVSREETTEQARHEGSRREYRPPPRRGRFRPGSHPGIRNLEALR